MLTGTLKQVMGSARAYTKCMLQLQVQQIAVISTSICLATPRDLTDTMPHFYLGHVFYAINISDVTVSMDG